MRNVHEFEAETVEKAIAKAEKTLHTPANALHIDIICHGENLFFGLRKSKAKIRAWTEEPLEESWLDTLDSYLDEPLDASRDENLSRRLEGTAWMKDGVLYFEGNGPKRPVLHLPDEVTASKNGRQTGRTTPLTEGDILEFSINLPPRETTWSVSIDKKQQLVTLNVKPGAYYTAAINDHPPAEYLYVSISKEETPLNQLTETDVIEQLERMDITYGIQTDVIREACASIQETTVQITAGKLPKHGKDGRIDFKINLQTEQKMYREKPDGTIDFRDSIRIPAVEEGVVLGSIIDPTAGEDGLSLFGDVLQAKAGRPIAVQAGAGIELDEETKTITASIAGRPLLKKQGQHVRLSILPKLVHDGNLQLGDGNIRFTGDVEVIGSVEDGMKVEAAGDVWIHAHSEQSSLHAAGSITVNGSVLHSTLTAGTSKTAHVKTIKLLKTFLHTYPSF
ncbi:flagellar assembly protein A [Alkalicoccus luteus]|uniref:flagellar assembly protein A n=1 Tax=Alkalicoccus luteus TaxID=1237094 RepID=UPI0040348EF6